MKHEIQYDSVRINDLFFHTLRCSHFISICFSSIFWRKGHLISDFFTLNIFPFVNDFTKGTFHFWFCTFHKLNFLSPSWTFDEGDKRPLRSHIRYTSLCISIASFIQLVWSILGIEYFSKMLKITRFFNTRTCRFHIFVKDCVVVTISAASSIQCMTRFNKIF